MTDDLYQLAIAAIRHHLTEADVPFDEEDGDFLINDHRLSLSVTFEDFARQDKQWIAPLDVQIHLDGDSGDRFRVGTLGVGGSSQEAMQSAVHEWHLLAAAPVLAALGAEVASRRNAYVRRLAGWDLFPGRMGIRGSMPAAMQPGGPFIKALVDSIRPVVASWEEPSRLSLKSVFIMASSQPEGFQAQGAVDGFLDQPLTDILQSLAWPPAKDSYFFKQLLVFRAGDLDKA